MWRGGVIVVLVSMLVGAGPAGGNHSGTVRLPIESAHTPPASSVVVVKGDSLWKISERHLPDRSAPVAGYWLKLIERNAPSLRSGDPDLIYPGEIIELP